MTTTTVTVLLFVAVAAAVAFMVWAFHHDHARGHCGHAGCQRPATRRTR